MRKIICLVSVIDKMHIFNGSISDGRLILVNFFTTLEFPTIVIVAKWSKPIFLVEYVATNISQSIHTIL